MKQLVSTLERIGTVTEITNGNDIEKLFSSVSLPALNLHNNGALNVYGILVYVNEKTFESDVGAVVSHSCSINEIERTSKGIAVTENAFGGYINNFIFNYGIGDITGEKVFWVSLTDVHMTERTPEEKARMVLTASEDFMDKGE